MKKWMVFLLVFFALLSMIFVGLKAISNHHERAGMFFTFVGGMTVIGLVLDIINHLRTRRST